jgi:hypothetical protein
MFELLDEEDDADEIIEANDGGMRAVSAIGGFVCFIFE